jgi:DNA-directed RNA polymerase specialized sigma24 family protein
MKHKASSSAQFKIDLKNPIFQKFFGFSQTDFLQFRSELLAAGRIIDFLLYIEPQTAHFLTKYKTQLGETDCEDIYNRCLDKFCQEVLVQKDFAERDANPLAYLSIMLNNTMLQAIERKKTTGTISLDAIEAIAQSNSDNYDLDLENALVDLENALEIMCNACNEIVDAHYWKGLKPAKIAELVTQKLLLWLCFGFPKCGIRQNVRTNEIDSEKQVTPNEVSQRLVRIRKDIFNYMNQKKSLNH